MPLLENPHNLQTQNMWDVPKILDIMVRSGLLDADKQTKILEIQKQDRSKFAGEIAISNGYLVQEDINTALVNQSVQILSAATKNSADIGNMDLSPPNKAWLTKVPYRLSKDENPTVKDTTNISNLARYMVVQANEMQQKHELTPEQQEQIQKAIGSLNKVHQTIRSETESDLSQPNLDPALKKQLTSSKSMMQKFANILHVSGYNKPKPIDKDDSTQSGYADRVITSQQEPPNIANKKDYQNIKNAVGILGGLADKGIKGYLEKLERGLSQKQSQSQGR